MSKSKTPIINPSPTPRELEVKRKPAVTRERTRIKAGEVSVVDSHAARHLPDGPLKPG